jgi:flagellar biosynthesis GTPase FlhF
MKLVGVISTAVLSLTLGVAAPAYAQQEQRDQQEEQKDKPAQEKEKKTQPDKAAKQEEKTAPRQEKNAKQESPAPQQEKNAKQEEKSAQQQQQHTQQAKPEQQAQRAGGNGGGRIPDDRFRANFGREHTFRVTQADYNRDRRFQYGGYWFAFVDAWPSNWLYTQDVFVVEINGVYYLCNAMYPGVNIALIVAI